MLTNVQMLQALTARVEEQNKALTLYAQEELGLPANCEIKLKASIKQIKVRDLKPARHSSRDLNYDQEPTEEDWQVVTEHVKSLAANARPGKASGMLWRNMVIYLDNLHKAGNVEYVGRAVRLNVNFDYHRLPYRLVRVEEPGEGTLYALRVARSS